MQNQANEQWDPERINEGLTRKLHAAVDAVFSRWQAFVVGEDEPERAGDDLPAPPDFRTVALVIAIERVTGATLMRGIWP